MWVNSLSILAGQNKNGTKEKFTRIDIKTGETISIVGPTGSGKTAFMVDIEMLAQRDTDTKRKILINNKVPEEEQRYNPSKKPVVMISQNTKCFADIKVEQFLTLHAKARGIDRSVIAKTIHMANQFTGEPLNKNMKVTSLSGGQTRSLLIADAILIGSAPIILLDELENAGINKKRIIEIIHASQKIALFVTHDPIIALLTKRRLIMKNGEVCDIIDKDDLEDFILKELVENDTKTETIRSELRAGHKVRMRRWA